MIFTTRLSACRVLFGVAGLLAGLSVLGPTRAAEPPRSWWPRPWTVEGDSGRLILRTPYCSFEHDLRRGGAISAIRLVHGKAPSLVVRPVETRVRGEDGAVFSDIHDPAPRVERATGDLAEVVTVECGLLDGAGRPSGIRLRSVHEYRWGYVRVRKELVFPDGGMRAREVCGFATVLAPSLRDYGYREGVTEADGAPPFSFGSCRWGRVGEPSAGSAHGTSHVPRYLVFAEPGVEGLEWFVGSDLSQWEVALGGRRGAGQCVVAPCADPAGVSVAVSPLHLAEGSVSLAGSRVLEYRIGVPLLEGRASRPWFHASFNRNRGEWVSSEQVRAWADSGVRTVHCHNDGDYYDDGLFWRDGSYPPYPADDMAKYDRVTEECHRVGIRAATYFSNKELHPSTAEFREHGEEWGRNDTAGKLQHNFFRAQSEFGVQMCLRSGWLGSLKSSIDRVLSRHPLDGVYYDWNVALLCANPRHEAGDAARGAASGGEAAPVGHWDMDQLLDLMEWTRRRVGPDGLVIVHNTTTPMFATENFATHVVAMEWGYGRWSEGAPPLGSLPLEWSFVGARPRGVISYGAIDAGAPRRFHRLFALQSLVSGVTPWPAGPEAFDVYRTLAPIGDLETCRFGDWRRPGVVLDGERCAAAAWGRPGEACIVVANLEEDSREIRCLVRPEALPYPLSSPASAAILRADPAAPGGLAETALDAGRLTAEGIPIAVPGDGAVVLRLR